MTIRSYIVKRADRTDDGHARCLVVRAYTAQEASQAVPESLSAAPWEPATRPEHRLRWQPGHPVVLLATGAVAYPEIVALGNEQTGEDCVYRSVPGTNVQELAERIFVSLVATSIVVKNGPIDWDSVTAKRACKSFDLAEVFAAEAAKRGVR